MKYGSTTEDATQVGVGVGVIKQEQAELILEGWLVQAVT
jgi:hypothetical protein